MELSNQQKVDLLIAAEKEERLCNKLRYFRPQDWQCDFLSKTNDYLEIWMSKCNRVGGTTFVAWFVAVSLTGRYDQVTKTRFNGKPFEWNGRRWDKPIRALLVGTDFKGVKKSSQRILFGDRPETFGIGNEDEVYPMIPKDAIIKITMSNDHPGCIEQAWIRHVSGGESVITICSQEQKPSVIMGDEYNLVWPDEFPENEKWYDQAKTRTWTTKGLMLTSATPEHGPKKMPIINRFSKEVPKDSKGNDITYYRKVQLHEAEHLTKDEIADIIEQTPEWLRPFRIYGQWVYGKGLLYRTPDGLLRIPRNELPRYQSAKHICGLDWGRSDYGALVWIMITSDHFYLWDCCKIRDLSPGEVSDLIKERDRQVGFKIPVVMGRDATNKDGTSGTSIWEMLSMYGVNVIPDAAHNAFANDKTNTLRPGIMEMQRLMKGGLFHVADEPFMETWFEEKNTYFVNEEGDIPKKKEARFDLLDATRYAVMMSPYAESHIHMAGRINTVSMNTGKWSLFRRAG